MRSITLLAIITFLGITPAKSQSYGFGGIGYNMSFLQSDGLDFVIGRYNDTRAYLTETMENPRYFDGISIHFGGAQKAFLFDFGYTQQSCVVSASGVDQSGIEQQRDVKDKWNTIDIGLGVSAGASDHFSLAAGVNFGLNSEKYLTRAETPDNIGTANFAQINKQFKFGISPFVQFTITGESAGLLIRPYYAWSPVKTDYYDLNAYINPYTYILDPINIEGTLKGFGVSVLFILYEYQD